MQPESGGVFAHRGTPAIQRMVEYAPATGSLALWVRHQDVDEAESDVSASNDGLTIRYAPSFERLSLARQTGLVAHQVLHVALRHAPRYLELRRQLGDVDLELFNICADAIVNSTLKHLSWLEIAPEAGVVWFVRSTAGDDPVNRLWIADLDTGILGGHA